MSTTFLGNGKKFSDRKKLEKYLEGIERYGFGAANTLKECIKSLKDRLLIEQIHLLEEKSTLIDLKFDVDHCDREVLEKIALYHLHIYDVTYHGEDFVFLQIKRSMEDGQDGWYKATKSIAKDNFAVTMYKDVKRGQEKYSDAKIVKDTVSLIDDNRKSFSDCELSHELIATIVKKKMYYLLLPVQLETLLDESEKVQVDEDISLFDVFTNVGEINSTYSKSLDPHHIGYEVDYSNDRKTNTKIAEDSSNNEESDETINLIPTSPTKAETSVIKRRKRSNSKGNEKEKFNDIKRMKTRTRSDSDSCDESVQFQQKKSIVSPEKVSKRSSRAKTDITKKVLAATGSAANTVEGKTLHDTFRLKKDTRTSAKKKKDTPSSGSDNDDSSDESVCSEKPKQNRTKTKKKTETRNPNKSGSKKSPVKNGKTTSGSDSDNSDSSDEFAEKKKVPAPGTKKKKTDIKNPYKPKSNGKSKVGQGDASSFGFSDDIISKIKKQRSSNMGVGVKGREKSFVVTFSKPFHVGRSDLKVVMFVEAKDGSTSDNLMFLWKARGVATAFTFEAGKKVPFGSEENEHNTTIFEHLTQMSFERKVPGSEDNEKRMVGLSTKYSVPILFGVIDILGLEDINDEDEIKAKLTELSNALKGVLGHQMFYPAYLVGCHREFSYRKVGDEMCDDFFFANFKWKYAGFAKWVADNKHTISSFKNAKFSTVFDASLDEKLIDEGIVNILKDVYGEHCTKISESGADAIFMNPEDRDVNDIMH